MHNRFFTEQNYIYDMDNPNSRAIFDGYDTDKGHHKLQEIVDQLNESNTRGIWLWTNRIDNQPWPKMLDEYALALEILGEDYFA